MNHKHQKEFELWQKTQTIDRPYPLVYVLYEGKWLPIFDPHWNEKYIYIVDNEYAQLRMDAIDSGSEIQYLNAQLDLWAKLPPGFIYVAMAEGLKLRLKPKDEPKSELDILKEKYATDEYVLLLNVQDLWTRWNKIETLMLPRHKLIHKRHEEVLNAYLEDNSVEIEIHKFHEADLIPYWVDTKFIEEYHEANTYRLKPLIKQQNKQKTKIVKEWLVKALNSNNWSVMCNTMTDEEAKEFFSKKGHEYIPTDREWEVPNV